MKPNRKRKSIGNERTFDVELNKEKHDKDPVALQRRINELEKQLETAQLKAEGYALMIEIAEKELKIPIRKKSGTK